MDPLVLDGVSIFLKVARGCGALVINLCFSQLSNSPLNNAISAEHQKIVELLINKYNASPTGENTDVSIEVMQEASYNEENYDSE